MSTVDLLFAIAVGFCLMMIILQAFLTRAVHGLYTFGLPVILIVWVLVTRVL